MGWSSDEEDSGAHTQIQHDEDCDARSQIRLPIDIVSHGFRRSQYRLSGSEGCLSPRSSPKVDSFDFFGFPYEDFHTDASAHDANLDSRTDIQLRYDQDFHTRREDLARFLFDNDLSGAPGGGEDVDACANIQERYYERFDNITEEIAQFPFEEDSLRASACDEDSDARTTIRMRYDKDTDTITQVRLPCDEEKACDIRAQTRLRLDADSDTVTQVQLPYDKDFDIRTQIRLVSFEPIRGEDSVCLRLAAFSLTSAPRYTALSYMWGEKTGDCEITINEHSVLVRPNCYYALRQLRESGLSAYYWLDAISIDQSNSQERGHQVQMMANIFMSAQQVAVSYGVETGANLAFTRMLLQLDVSDTDRAVRKLGPLEADEHAGLHDLVHRPYWNRMWIVQELAVARSVVVLTDGTTLPLPFVFKFIHTLCSDRRLQGDGIVDINNPMLPSEATALWNTPMMTLGYSLHWQASDLVRSARGFWRTPLHEALIYFGNKVCEDVRDRVYAIMSLVVKPWHLERLTVDYSL